MPSSQRSKSSSRRQRHPPLADSLSATGPLRTKSKKRKSRHDEEEEAQPRTNNHLDSRASRKILKIGQDLEDEDLADVKSKQPNPAFAFESRFQKDEEEESEEEVDERQYGDEDDGWGSEGNDAADPSQLEDPRDADLFDKFNPSAQRNAVTQSEPDSGGTEEQTINLADLILEKIALHEAAQAGAPTIQGGGPPEDAIEIPQKVVDVYTKIGQLLSRYRSGPLPKPFKILPTLPQYPILLSITRPDSWTPNAVFAATRVFVSSSPAVAQEFLREVVLERVKSDIHETRKLNVHLYDALRKSLYKPAAFFKGFLFPLLEEGMCTLREAKIVSSVLVRCSVPVLHSAAALLRLTELAAELMSSRDVDAAGAVNMFIKVLLEKKYALPYRVVDGLVFHFLRYKNMDFSGGGLDGMGEGGARRKRGGGEPEDGKLPVVWHQCLLAFAQRYRNDVTEDQREALLDLLLVKGHKDIGSEVRRELLAGRGRGVEVKDEETRWDGDDTMVMD